MSQVNLEVSIPELGLTFQQLLDSIKTIFLNINIDTENLFDAFSVDTALGIDLDHIGNLFSIKRNSGESDIDYRARLILFLGDHDKRALAIGDITELSQRILGIDPLAVREYPDFNFIHHTGRTHPGVHVEYTVAQIETYLNEFKIFRDIIQLYKAVGVPFIIGPIEFLTEIYTSFYNFGLLIGLHFQPNEKLFEFPIARFDSAGEGFNYGSFDTQGVIAIDHWGSNVPFLQSYELITDIIDIIKLIGTLFVVESYSETIGEDLLVGLGFKEGLHKGYDVQRFGSGFDNDFEIIDTFQIKDIALPLGNELLSVYSDTILLNPYGYFTELVSSFVDTIKIPSDMKVILTELISTYVDTIKAPSGMKVFLSELLLTFVDTKYLNVKISRDETVSSILEVMINSIKALLSETISTLVDTFLGEPSLEFTEDPYTGATVSTSRLVSSHFDRGLSMIGLAKIGETTGVHQFYVGGKVEAHAGFNVARFDHTTPIIHLEEEYS